MDSNNNMDTEVSKTPRHHRRPDEDSSRDRFFKTRNVLNILFMLGAIIGILLYLFASHTVGTIVILASMIFKVVECSLRFIHS